MPALFVTPGGELFWSIGLNHLDSTTLRSAESGALWHEKYGNSNHPRAFTFEAYRWLDLPYGHQLPFIESHQCEAATRLPDLRSKGFAEWCDDVARAYYRVTTEAVRRHDPNHLIFGDRCEANRPLPEEVLSAARPYVDVFAFQCFGAADVVSEKLGRWASFLEDKPVLLADNAP